MSTSHETPPESFALDYHTQQFFEPSDHDGPVVARFNLDVPDLDGIVFIGRAARFIDGNVHLVVRNIEAKPGDTGEIACLVLVLPLPINAVDVEERAKAVGDYFRQNLRSPPRAAKVGDGEVEAVPTLSGALVQVGFMRLHFEAAIMLGLEWYPEGGCNLIDMRGYPNIKEERPFVELGDALYDYEPSANLNLAFVQMNDSLFHARIESLVADFEGPLYNSMRFHCLSEEERSVGVFGCDQDSLQRALELLRLALIIEMGAGGSLDGWTEATWRPWGEEEMIEGRGERGDKVMEDVPVSLEKWLNIVGEKNGVKLNEEVRLDDQGIHQFARRWVGNFKIEAQNPSAHELVEAGVRLQEMLG